MACAGSQKKVIDPARKEECSRVDKALMAVVEKIPQLRVYLRARFSLTNGQFPHELKF